MGKKIEHEQLPESLSLCHGKQRKVDSKMSALEVRPAMVSSKSQYVLSPSALNRNAGDRQKLQYKLVLKHLTKKSITAR